jgi:hypothetical protein
MAESSNDKVWWLPRMLGRLVLVTVAWFGLSLLSLRFGLDIGFHNHAFFVLFLGTLSLMAGYVWVFYSGLLFLRSRANHQRLLVSVLIALPLAAVCCVTIYGSLFYAFDWDGLRGAEFISPTNPEDRIFFTEGGFRDRDLDLYARPKAKNEQFVGSLGFTGEYSLAYAQWTADGQALACTMSGRQVGNSPAVKIIYDFSTHKALNWGDDASIQKIIALHGGLTPQHITEDMITKNEKRLYFWQIPKR